MSKIVSKYKLLPRGVVRFDGSNIQSDPNNTDWQEYLLWLLEGNTPQPEFTQAELDEQALQNEVASLKEGLQKAMVWQFRMLQELFRLLKMGTSIRNADVDPVILAKAQEWATKLNRLKEIDE